MSLPFRVRATLINIGRRVKAQRVALDMTQKDLGEKSRVTYNFISRFELGTVNCSLVTLMYLADGLGTTLAQLIQDAPEDVEAVTLSVEDMRLVREALSAIDKASRRKRAGKTERP